ncbi:hypothetical protein [Alteromonas lipolytica]|uniref:Anti-sigma factor n=1 Tax=Alteromonas lipolytica TaxID=1856405 RepID=A0A1E8FD31_9ALTE|nr:hypothetical protein [Alteromonas lipolytica]OFI33847.1 hypothetical protein BFC17_19965 [Alteromonas lipolytica]GGF67881.1 hypothetical protein GCM10011338_20090 [Alteromonas lipolytica]
MVNQSPEYLLAQWLDNALSNEERRAFEALCVSDADFAATVQNATQLNVAAEQFSAPPMPAWNKNASFIAPDKPRWWQWQGLPAVSMAMSVVAMVMVISGFSVQVADGRVTLGFGSAAPEGLSETQVAALVNQRISDYQQSNQAMFTQYVNALKQQQQENSTQLAQYLLTSSRQERREDFAELVQFINQQRDDDQRYYARQLTHLQREINAIDDGYSAVTE